ncbi:cytochrome P450 27C1 isoform X3 [Sceloporus undulatus]|uniref:cytochrome P450 27C1 isoform X3 n=1 Tax=Sceloporus undulatus TaxID=8520 RepID=UPI001C4D6830|nr:cytochrome P450 27C1 isoform X3 [Sceloporus undulatus]
MRGKQGFVLPPLWKGSITIMSLLSKIWSLGCKQVLELRRIAAGVPGFLRLHQLPRNPGEDKEEEEEEEKKEDEEGAPGQGSPKGFCPQRHPSPSRAKSLQEMPGPRTFSNLVEFFWKDGFGRIHEIQIEIWWLRFSGKKALCLNGLTWILGRNTEIYEGELQDLYLRVATVLYECRLGCLESDIPQNTAEYIEALELMFSSFKTTMYAGAIPKWLRPIIPKPWREFCRSWDGLFKFSQIHVDNKLNDIKSHLDQGEEIKGGLLTTLLQSKELTVEEIYANMTEMLLAGVDTTSFTLSWATYMLAKHPEVQHSVYKEIVHNLGKDKVPDADDIPNLPMTRALLKETLRLFPVLPGNGRVTQKDMIVGGYLIPKGTQLALCHYATSYQEENFPSANEFQPDRWLRKSNMDRVDNFGSIPFGYGIRSCIGKRIAELEIYLALIQLLQNFEIKISPKTKPVCAKTHGLLTPGDSINVKFADRK